MSSLQTFYRDKPYFIEIKHRLYLGNFYSHFSKPLVLSSWLLIGFHIVLPETRFKKKGFLCREEWS